MAVAKISRRRPHLGFVNEMVADLIFLIYRWLLHSFAVGPETLDVQIWSISFFPQSDTFWYDCPSSFVLVMQY